MAKKDNEKNLPVYTEKELSQAEQSFLNGDQLKKMFSRTPKEHQYKRPAKGGGEWTYVTGIYVKKVLNFVFGWDWDFVIVNFEANTQAKQCIVHGRLTVRNRGKVVMKEQFGRADMKFKKVQEFDADGKKVWTVDKNGKKRPQLIQSDEPLDLGNDLKAASTDALKKCASELGLAADVYGMEEFKEIKVASTDEASSVEYWREKISDAIDMCQDTGLAEAVRKEAIELYEKNAPVEDYIKLLKRLEK